MLFTGDKINGIEAEKLGLVLKSVPHEQLDMEIETLARRMATVPINQLIMHKLMILHVILQKVWHLNVEQKMWDGKPP
jgi:enoyl-CoA hydratase